MKSKLIIAFSTIASIAIAQSKPARLIYNSNINSTSRIECMPTHLMEAIEKESTLNIEKLKATGKLNLSTRSTVLFDWPLRLAAGRPNLPYYVTGNYVDLDQATSAIQDYNCGSQSYNNHTGVDIGILPFGWMKMDNSDVEVIAAADGQIIAKRDGDFDRNCGASAVPGNYIFLQHSDGTKTYYYHMKNGSVTSKAIGDNIVKGEYLGVVGSSGNSSGPHLHFEVRAANNALIDPYSGTCNAATSRWQSQKPYREPTILMVSTHANTLGPVFPACPNTENPRIKTNFVSGDLIDFFSYFHDQENGHRVEHKIYKPNNTLFLNWKSIFDSYIQVSIWAASWYLPNPAPAGTWRYEATYLGQTTTTNFTVNVALPVELLSFNIFPRKDIIDLTWATATERNNAYFTVERSSDGITFTEIGKVKGAGNSEQNVQYNFSDNQPLALGYYRLKQVDNDGTVKISHTLSAKMASADKIVKLFPNPFKDRLYMSEFDSPPQYLSIFNSIGQIVLEQKISSNEIDVSSLAKGIYFIEVITKKDKFVRKLIKE